ncbi:MAG TPA: 3-dehydroquinate synthase [Candidatus Sumerlaeota bacterium]|nr:3-dehydroquinate synthase [Candidatus Sumerlaeota bacterium]
MIRPGEAELLRVYIAESDKYQGKPLYEVIVSQARERKMAGATVLRGLEGFGIHSHLHSAHILRLSVSLPLVVEIVDTAEKIEAFLPSLSEWLGEGMATVERVRVVAHHPPQAESAPSPVVSEDTPSTPAAAGHSFKPVTQKDSPMEEILVGLGDRQYPIRIGCDCVAALGAQAREALPRCDRIAVVSNPEIARLHGAAVLESLCQAGFNAELIEIPEGEAQKTVETVHRIWDHLIEHGYTRQSALVALGGGVVGDMTGFAAATYMRGIEFIQVPTTLLAMVDSSVGGKTGVNLTRAKNSVGAFWQPKLVFMDLVFLRTLPVEEFRSGFAEVIKHGVIRDADYFEFLEKNRERIFALDGEALVRVVAGSCRVKADVVAHDEREAGLRAILNFGHTVGHALEALSGYGQVRHGEAVAIGMVAAARIARAMGVCTDEALTGRLERLIETSGLPACIQGLELQAVLDRMKSDKKVLDGHLRFVLPVKMGEVVIRNDVPREILSRVIEEMGALRH